MKFYEWLNTINPSVKWKYGDEIALEKQIVDNIKESGYVNVKEIFNVFSLVDDPWPYDYYQEMMESSELPLPDRRSLVDL